MISADGADAGCGFGVRAAFVGAEIDFQIGFVDGVDDFGITFGRNQFFDSRKRPGRTVGVALEVPAGLPVLVTDQACVDLVDFQRLDTQQVATLELVEVGIAQLDMGLVGADEVWHVESRRRGDP